MYVFSWRAIALPHRATLTHVLLLFFSRILFKDKDRNWDEIENKLRSESDVPPLKTSNKVHKLVHLSNIS